MHAINFRALCGALGPHVVNFRALCGEIWSRTTRISGRTKSAWQHPGMVHGWGVVSPGLVRFLFSFFTTRFSTAGESRNLEITVVIIWVDRGSHEEIVGRPSETRISRRRSSLTREMAAAVRAEMAAAVRAPALWCAAWNGRTEIVRKLVGERPGDIEERGGHYMSSPLHAAAWAQPAAPSSSPPTEELAQVLLDHGADASSKDTNGRSPLLDATLQGRTALVQILLKHGADVAARDSAGRTPLHESASQGHEEVTLVLLKHGADVGAKDNAGRTPLHWAALMGHGGVALVLFEHGADAAAKVPEIRPRGLWSGFRI